MEIERDVQVLGECPKCGIPGIHKMPSRVLVRKLTHAKLARARERFEEAETRHYRANRFGYGMRDYGDPTRDWLDEAREKLSVAKRAAEAHTYALKRECYACDHVWFELLRRIESDREAEALRNRYPDGLVVQPA
jgi:hypothetical protein